MQYEMFLINAVFAAVSALLIIIYLKRNSVDFRTDRVIVFVITFGLLNGLLCTKTADLGDTVNSLKPLFLLIASVLCIKLILGIGWVKSINVFVLLMIGMGIGNSLGITIFGFFISGDVAYEVTLSPFLYFFSNVTVVVFAIAFLIIIKPINTVLSKLLDNRDLAFSLIFAFVIISATAALFYYLKVFNFAAFISISIMTILYTAYVIFNSALIYKRAQEKEEKEQQDFYNKSLENTLFELRRMKHDWSNNLMVLNSLLSMKKTDEALSYLQEIVEFSSGIETSMYNIKNAGLFGIISAKQQLAQSRGLNINISGVGEVGSIPKIKVSELCEIMGIILDNAIEESEKVKENIEFSFIDTDKAIEFFISNKCENDVDLKNLSSTKGNGRGNGLKIIGRIISKYKHIQNYRSYDKSTKTFEQTIIIEKGL